MYHCDQCGWDGETPALQELGSCTCTLRIIDTFNICYVA
jgi:hypothetical protein